MVAKAAGGIASTVAALPAMATAIGPSAIGNVAKATGAGALLGGAAGFGEGEGLNDRLMRAGVGGTIGGVVAGWVWENYGPTIAFNVAVAACVFGYISISQSTKFSKKAEITYPSN